MIVDDEEFCLNTLKIIFQRLGFDVKNQVDLCLTGLEALNSVKLAYSHNFSYSLILTDFHMPEMDGMTATKQIRRMLQDTY